MRFQSWVRGRRGIGRLSAVLKRTGEITGRPQSQVATQIWDNFVQTCRKLHYEGNYFSGAAMRRAWSLFNRFIDIWRTGSSWASRRWAFIDIGPYVGTAHTLVGRKLIVSDAAEHACRRLNFGLGRHSSTVPRHYGTRCAALAFKGS